MSTSGEEHEEDFDRQPAGLVEGADTEAEHSEQVQDAGQGEGPCENATASVKANDEPDHDTSQKPDPDLEHEEQDDEDEEIPYPEAEPDATGSSSLLPPPDFRPFFTLVEDANGDHHHPSVHYIFADDDPEILTDAALETLSTHHPQLDKDTSDQRFVVIDIAADGKEIVSASSLSPDWQALTTRTSPAPSWGGQGGKGSADRGLMLTISGQEAREERSGAKGKRKKIGGVDGLLKAFDANLCSLDGVLGTEVTDVVDTHIAQHE